MRDEEEEEDAWVEARGAAGPDDVPTPSATRANETEIAGGTASNGMDMDEDEEIGPLPPRQTEGRVDERACV